jgi:hypothetical protein
VGEALADHAQLAEGGLPERAFPGLHCAITFLRGWFLQEEEGSVYKTNQWDVRGNNKKKTLAPSGALNSIF